jgi:beta-lactamase regulating signal transducer with metallopeptidase domain
MAADVLIALARANLAASLAIVLVFLARASVRRWFGAQLAYAAWILVPIAAAGSLTPLDVSARPLASARQISLAAKAWLTAGPDAFLAGLWLIGVAASLGWVAWSQFRYSQAARAGLAGPAVFGVVAPRLVVPFDYAVRFTPEQRRLIRAHERAHMDRLDPRYNALAVLMQCLGWFNPLLHLAARAMRLDQELACDATVVARLPGQRRRYAEALLSSQRTSVHAPLGCHWGGGAHPLEARIVTLMRPQPAQERRDAGMIGLAILAAVIGVAAWAAQPPMPHTLYPIVTVTIDGSA